MKKMTVEEIQKALGYEIEIVAEKPKEKVWKPKLGETYWYVDYDGTVCRSEWGGLRVEKSLYALGNCFKTKEEAEFYKEKLIVTAELQRFADEHNETIDWEDANEYKYSIYYDTYSKQIHKTGGLNCKQTTIYFSSLEIANKAIETIGEERIKKYYLEVMK